MLCAYLVKNDITERMVKFWTLEDHSFYLDETFKFIQYKDCWINFRHLDLSGDALTSFNTPQQSTFPSVVTLILRSNKFKVLFHYLWPWRICCLDAEQATFSELTWQWMRLTFRGWWSYSRDGCMHWKMNFGLKLVAIVLGHTIFTCFSTSLLQAVVCVLDLLKIY